MERTTFLKYIQQKNDNADPRKLSFQSISSAAQEKFEKGIFQVECAAFHTQLPAFINRKVKNLKPYTNHFKRFNIQTTKIPDSPQKVVYENRQQTNNYESQKLKMAKSNLLKELGIGREIKPTETILKMPEISVYEQFLQKTSTIFTSNVIDSMYQNCIKKSAKLQKQTYQRSQRQYNQDNDENYFVSKQQRRSMNTNVTQDKQTNTLNKNSKKSIKSMNQLTKNDEIFLKSDKVCIIPNLVNFQHEDIFCKSSDKKSIITMKKKYSVPLKEAPKKDVSTFNESIRKKSQNYLNSKESSQVQISEKVFVSVPKNPQTLKKEEEETEREFVRVIANTNEKFFQKDSPKKQQNQAIFNFNVSLSNPKKQANKTPFIKNNKEEATINADKAKNKAITPDFPAPSNVTAYAYIVYEPSFSQNSKFKFTEQNLRNTNKVFGNNRVLASLNCKSVVEIASLTKIMTFLLALEICEKLKIDSALEKVRIGKFEASINGTSAEIQEGEMYTIEQLYYGLMLPSGNDASLALAIWGGKKLLIHEIKQKEKQRKKSTSQNFHPKISSQQQSNEGILKDHKKIVLKKKKCYERFILEMNKRARFLGMTKTTYANSHGLSNNLNKSCAFDLCILCEHAMMNQKFRKVVSTVDYKCKIHYEIISEDKQEHGRHLKVQEYENNTSDMPIDDVEHENEHSDEESTESLEEKDECLSPQLSTTERQKRLSLCQTNSSTKEPDSPKPILTYGERQVYWQNTHKLLPRQEYIGIKTGITNTAGPCLASCIKTKENRCFIIIVLNSKKLNYRFKDTETLRKWIYKREKLQKSPESKIAQYEEIAQQDQNQDSPGRQNSSQLRRSDQGEEDT